jgi:hypothetical protein
VNARELARWVRIVSSNRLVNPDPVTWSNTGRGGYCFSPDFCTDAEVLAGRTDAVSDVSWPREVARYCVAQGWGTTGYWCGPDRGKPVGDHPADWTGSITIDGLARRCDMLTLPAARSGACPLFVELCAGLASVSLVLQGGRHARPPVSRMGNKRGYAEAILWACGLRQGQGAQRFLWCEPDPGCSALLRAYGQPEVLREAAEIIRGWADEDPRELWERLKAEGPIRSGEAGEVARWAQVQAQTRPDGQYDIVRSEGSHGWAPAPRGWVAGRMDAMPCLPAVTVAPDAREIDPPDLPAGSVVFIDPPYVGTTGYGHDLPRAAVVEMARRWKDAGALVCISEQEALPELMAEGWHALDITSTRKGQKRTFSKQQAEWLTMSEAPRWRPAVQVGLFG